jgi:hypothetical protein
MGLFDKITCAYLLPLPEEASLLEKAPDWDELEFDTGSFALAPNMGYDGFIEEYSIEEDGQIYKKDLQREFIETGEGVVVDEIDNGIEKVDFTGEIRFNTTLMESEHDYFIEFIALFWKGDLKEISLGEWEKESNESRLGAQNRIKEAVRKQLKQKNNKIIKLLKWPLSFVFFIVKYILGLIIKCVWWLERRLT